MRIQANKVPSVDPAKDFFNEVPLGTVFSFEVNPDNRGLGLQEIKYDAFHDPERTAMSLLAYRPSHLYTSSNGKCRNLYAVLIDKFTLNHLNDPMETECGIFIIQDMSYHFMMSYERIYLNMNWSSHEI